MTESPYVAIAANLDSMAMRAPRSKSGDGFSEAFLDYLQLLYTLEEAKVARHLKVVAEIFSITFDPTRLMTPIQLAKVSGQPLKEVNKALKQMADKNVVLDIRKIIQGSNITWPIRLVAVLWKIYKGEGLKETTKAVTGFFTSTLENAREYGMKSCAEFISLKLYALPHIPLVINIQNFQTKITQEVLEGAELYKKFFVEEKYSKLYQTGAKGTPLTRTIPISKALAPQQKILDTEEAHKIIDAAASAVLAPCPCRERTEKLGTRECKERNPVGSCIMLGLAGMAFEGMGLGKSVTKKEAKDYLTWMMERGLVAVTGNVEGNTSSLICLCCECCCSQTRGRLLWGNATAIAPSNFFPRLKKEKCAFCGRCEDRCMFHAITVDKDNKRWKLNPEPCIGCGVCAVGCFRNALKLHRAERNNPFKTPQDIYRHIYVENR